jgi:hypothetical protein
VPVSPDGAARFAKILADLYGDASAHLIGIVAERLAAGIEQRGWAEQKLTEILRLRRDAQRYVARLADEADASILDLLTQAYAEGVLAAGGPGVQAASPALVATNRGAVQAYAAELAGRTSATHTRILRTAEDVYRTAVADVAGQVITGAQTRREAAARAVTRLTAAGITGFTDRAGRNWELGSYVEMAARTTVGQAHVQGGLDRYTQQGRDLVIVSDAPEECAKCRPFEGRVLSLSGREPAPAEVAGHRYGGTLAHARREGFLHPNCRHALSAFTPGLTRPPRGDLADPEGDQQRQQQRYLERQIRDAKRKVAAAEPFGDTQELRMAQALVRLRQRSMRDFLEETGRKRLGYRQQLGAR